MADRARSWTADRIESAVQTVILLGVGGMAGAVSFAHVHGWTVANGQASWVGWTNAMITELLQIAGGLELRRRKRKGLSATFVLVVLVAAVVVSLTAQVSQAAPSPSGWLVAALPSLGFLCVVKIVMARTVPAAQSTAVPDNVGRHARPDGRPDTGPPVDQRLDGRPGLLDDRPGPAQAPDEVPSGMLDAGLPDRTTVTAVLDNTGTVPDDPTPVPDERTVASAVPDEPDERRGTVLFDAAQIDVGRQALAALTASGDRVNRDTFATAVRAAGGRLSNRDAGALLRYLREEAA